MIPGLRDAGDAAQKNFTPEWIIKTAGAAAKRWFLENLAKDLNVPALAEEINASGDDLQITKDGLQTLLEKTWDHLRRKY